MCQCWRREKTRKVDCVREFQTQLQQTVTYSMELNDKSIVFNTVKLAMASGTVPVKELLASCIPCKPSSKKFFRLVYCVYH